MGKTSIEWTDESSNPIVPIVDGKMKGWFCTKVSRGCAHCFSERMNLWVGNQLPYTKANEHQVKFMVKEKELERVAKLPAGTKVFMCDMIDLFHPLVWNDALVWLFRFMKEQAHLMFQILTKRPERMHTFSKRLLHGDYLPNVWLGVSCEDQKAADERLPFLINTPAAVRFVSCEPLLGAVDVASWGWRNTALSDPRIDWVIAGGESDPKGRARPMQIYQVRDLRNQCQAAGVPFFFKQWGDYVPVSKGERAAYERAGWDPQQKRGGRVLDGRTWEEFPDG